MSDKPNYTLRQAIALPLLLYASWWAQPYAYHYDTRYFVWGLWGFTALIAAKLTLKFLFQMLKTGWNGWRRKVKNLHGSARWATAKNLKEAGLFKRGKWFGSKRRRFFLGMFGKQAVWKAIESCGLVLSPAGGGKTVCFVIPALLHNDMSMIVADLKGTLAAITLRLRKKLLKHFTYVLNPAGLYSKILGLGARYNPLSLLVGDWDDETRHHFLMSDARMLALQLLPEPKQEGANVFFRNGSRKLLIFAMLYQVIFEAKATFSAVLELLSDVTALETALYVASADDRLSGDMARLAKDILSKLTSGRAEQFESFREGAVQVLEPYAPSGVLADATSDCDFSFADLRKKKGTVYIVCDPTQMEAFAPWLGMVFECAKTELIRSPQGEDVCFMIDEATNFRFESLPSLMTAAREFKIRIWVVVQELEQWAHRYGREALDTLLSQTEVKIIHGSRSHKTCQLVSDMLGDYSVMAKSRNLGRSIFDDVTTTESEVGRKMMTAEEVARTDKAIVFTDDAPPMLLDKVGYHEVTPWRRRADPNPLFGKKRYKGKVKLRL